MPKPNKYESKLSFYISLETKTKIFFTKLTSTNTSSIKPGCNGFSLSLFYCFWNPALKNAAATANWLYSFAFGTQLHKTAAATAACLYSIAFGTQLLKTQLQRLIAFIISLLKPVQKNCSCNSFLALLY